MFKFSRFENSIKHLFMKYIFLTLLFGLKFSIAQKARDITLINKLDSLKKVDQFWRGEGIKLQNGEEVSTRLILYEIIKKSIETDSLNHIEIKRIVEEHGFPGFDLVGKEGSGSFWLLIQNQDNYSNFQLYVLDLMEAEVKN